MDSRLNPLSSFVRDIKDITNSFTDYTTFMIVLSIAIASLAYIFICLICIGVLVYKRERKAKKDALRCHAELGRRAIDNKVEQELAERQRILEELQHEKEEELAKKQWERKRQLQLEKERCEVEKGLKRLRNALVQIEPSYQEQIKRQQVVVEQQQQQQQEMQLQRQPLSQFMPQKAIPIVIVPQIIMPLPISHDNTQKAAPEIIPQNLPQENVDVNSFEKEPSIDDSAKPEYIIESTVFAPMKVAVEVLNPKHDPLLHAMESPETTLQILLQQIKLNAWPVAEQIEVTKVVEPLSLEKSKPEVVDMSVRPEIEKSAQSVVEAKQPAKIVLQPLVHESSFRRVIGPDQELSRSETTTEFNHEIPVFVDSGVNLRPPLLENIRKLEKRNDQQELLPTRSPTILIPKPEAIINWDHTDNDDNLSNMQSEIPEADDDEDLEGVDFKLTEQLT